MTDVVYTANDGYYFPTDYSVAAVNGISVTRNSYTQITVSGTPTADATITLTAPTAKTTPDAPTTAAATDCTTADNNDGKLTGVTAEMEYTKPDAAEWTAGTGSDITGLAPGTYYVRVKATETTNASGNQELTIADYNTAAANTVRNTISALPAAADITLDNAQAVADAKAAYDALTDDQKTLVPADTVNKLNAAVAKIADLTAANTVSNTISALPDFSNVTTANKDAIEAARTAYNALTDDQKAYVSADTLKKLTDDEDKLVIIQVMSEVSAKTGSGMTYTGNPIQLINTPTTALPTGYIMKYAVTTENTAPSDNLYTTSIPTATDAGTYYVWYKVTGDDNHKDTKALSVTSSILPVDRDNLNKLIGEAEDYLETIQEKYPDIAKDLEAAISEARGIAENPNAKAEEIAEQIRKLTEALEKAKKAVKDAEDQAAAKAVKDLIDALPDADKVTISDKAAIEAARKVYDALTEDQKKLISAETLKHLTDDEEALANLDVKAVISQINALPDADKVTISDKEAIEAARKAYDALTAEKKQLVPAEVLKKLTDDEAALAAAEASEADRAAADAVVKMINALPDADKVTISDKEAIEAARKAYDALTAEKKQLVPAEVLKKLTDDEAALAAAEASEADRAAADAVVKMINALPDADKVTINDKEAIEAARKAYDALTVAQKKLVTADVLKKLTDDEAALKGKSISYKTYEGEGGEYKHGSDGTLTFVFKRSENDSETFARFTGLKYDGKSLTRDKDYTAKAGSVIITLDHELLESMMVGNHILTAVFDDGEADAHFTVIANAEPTATPTAAPTATPTPTPTPKPVPKTGDNSNPVLWLAMMILGLAVLAGTAVKVYRKRQ